jgi:hypothetical protein
MRLIRAKTMIQSVIRRLKAIVRHITVNHFLELGLAELQVRLVLKA